MTEEEDKTFSLELDSALDDEFAEEEDFSSSAELLLGILVSLELDCGEMVEEDDSSSFGTTLLLDLSFSLELDSAPDDEFSEEEDFSLSAELLLDFTLLLDSGSEPEITEDEDSSSSFGATLLLLSSPHAARNAPNIKEIATHLVLAMTFRIKPPSPQWLELFFGNIIIPNAFVQKGGVYPSNFQPQSLW